MQQVVTAPAQVPGAVLGLAQGNSIIFMEAFGDRNADTGKALAVDNLLHIGSTNKIITSFLIAALVDEGVMQWDTRAIDIYPDFKTSDSAASMSITIRQLLDMTSGLPRDAEIETYEPARALFDRLSEQTLITAPGTSYQYSNLSSSLAGYLAVLANTKAKNGKIIDSDLNNLHSGYTDLLQSKVLTPIGMGSSTLSANEALATGRLSQAHERVDSKFAVSLSIDNDPDNIAPAGGLKSTVSDMLGYIITDMQQGVSPTGVRVVSAANVAERQKLSVGPAGASEYGLSIEIVELANSLNYIGHSGSFGNFNSIMGFFPQKQLAFVLLTNGESPEALKLTGTQENSLVERLSKLLE
jgi:CubicO group peptidase (beta-lactamase class C family)